MLKIYNSLTQQKEAFSPIEPNKVKLYACGMTVYDYCHIGHVRGVMITFDVVVRFLRWVGMEVTYVRNITDIDDKIIKRANENNEPFEVVTDRFINIMQEDEAALGLLRPDLEPRATAHMDDVIAMIQKLMDKGVAYQTDGGDVNYRVRAFEGYGKLSKRDLDQMRSGARVEVDSAKEDPLDFVLWKAAKVDEPHWESPWGIGRPGWHIECSAMSTKCLGNHFDIHGGGADLMFPHHENEIAQSEAATGEPFANVWMHTGFLNINHEKMSKSLGNFFTIRDVLKVFHPEVLRFFIVSSHYRSPLNYSDEALEQAKRSLETLYLAIRDCDVTQGEVLEEYKQRFIDKMEDDFNTAEAVAILFELAKAANVAKGADKQNKVRTLHELANVLGLFQYPVEDYLKSGLSVDEAEIEALIEQRNEARANKDWATSDSIRDQLAEQGILIEDAAGKTTWRRA